MNRSDSLGRSVAGMMARGATAAEARLIHVELVGCLMVGPPGPGTAMFVWPPNVPRRPAGPAWLR
jgi:hypothetical protein